MGTKDRVEACGRCAMSAVTGLAQEGDDEESGGRNPFDGARIELQEEELRKASPHVVALARVKRRLNEIATRLTYGR